LLLEGTYDEHFEFCCTQGAVGRIDSATDHIRLVSSS
jgi:hypothetical protein